MLLKQLKSDFLLELKDEYPPEEIHSIFFLLTEYFLGFTRLDLALTPDKELSHQELQEFKKALTRLKKNEPVQYITGKTEFFGSTFLVNKNVLVPRPETEELVQWILDDYKYSSKSIKILDIGTGSGCIAISMAKHLPDAKISAIDISKEALLTARENARHNKVQIEFIQADILQLDNLKEYDLIVSNPPYVRELEKLQMKKNVLEHEPSLALYVEDEDPLIFYKKITKLAKEGLNAGGNLYFEINQYLGWETELLLKKEGFSTGLKKDIFGNDRMLKGTL